MPTYRAAERNFWPLVKINVWAPIPVIKSISHKGLHSSDKAIKDPHDKAINGPHGSDEVINGAHGSDKAIKGPQWQ